MAAAPNPLTEPDRVAFAGDWHADARWAKRAIAQAATRGANTLVHLGDFGYKFHPLYLFEVSHALEAAQMPLLFVDGNHEDHVWLGRHKLARNGLRQLSEWIWHVPRGFRWRWHGLEFAGLGGAHSVDGIWRRQSGHMWHKEERITEAQATQVKGGGLCDVLISHDCPAGVSIPGLHPDDFPMIEILRAEEHRALLREVVDVIKPRAIWHGHYHVRYRQTPNFGYGPVAVTGLDANGTSMPENLNIVDLRDLAEGLPPRAC